VRGGRLLDDGADALLGELVELVERTEARVVAGMVNASYHAPFA